MPEAQALLGFIVARLHRLPEAESLLREAIAKRPDVPHWHFELRNILRYDFRLDEALKHAREAIRLDPKAAQFRNGLSQVCFDRGEYDLGYAAIMDALACDPEHPESHLSLAHALLALGLWRAGWAEYEWRFRSKLYGNAMVRPNRPIWSGAPLPGRTLAVSADQGFGDSFQFARYLPMAAARCGNLTLVCREPQVPLLSRVPGVARCVTDLREVGEHAAFCWMASLPYVFGTELSDVPGTIPYLNAPPDRRAAWRERLHQQIGSECPRIGLAWAGNPDNTADWRRSLPLSALEGLAALPGIQLVSLQKSVPEKDRPAFAAWGLVDFGDAMDDFAETAAMIANLDLIVTVDTVIAHLAGAMGLPVWTLIYEPCDWRWMTQREDSPWYPTMRLFRQPKAGAWEEPIARLTAELRRLAAPASALRQV
jgi:tetratricopeptide (TPR) repeat protein